MNKQKLKEILLADISYFKKFGVVIADSEFGPLIHINNGGQILGVAHLDWVKFNPNPIITNNYVINCPQLDDRLGAFVLLDHLKTKTNIPYDILLCDSEEIGRSTAGLYKTELVNKEYNWIFEFDRNGDDVVTYDYSEKWFDELLEAYDFKVGWGSFSDICKLEHLLIKGANIGVGYSKEHTDKCYADLLMMDRQVSKFAKMMEDFASTKLDHTPLQRVRYYDMDDDWPYSYQKYKTLTPTYQKQNLPFIPADETELDIESIDDDCAILIWCDQCYEQIQCEEGYRFCPFCGSDIQHVLGDDDDNS